MKFQPNPMPADFPDYGIPIFPGNIVSRLAYIPQTPPGFYLAQPRLQTLLCCFHKPPLLFADLSDTEHAGESEKYP